MTVVEPKAVAAAVMQLVEVSKRVHESAVARNEERAAARGVDALERARAAKRRELAALDEAVELHELAARLFESLGRLDQAAAARDRVDRARLAMVESVRERDIAEEIVARRMKELSSGSAPAGK